MKSCVSLFSIITLFSFSLLLAQENTILELQTPASDERQKAITRYWKKLEKLQAGYRKDFTKVLAHADKIEIYLVQFDGITEQIPNDASDLDSDEDGDKYILIAPYESYTKVLKRKTLTEAEHKEMLKAFTATISEENLGSGAFCHFPIHGMRIYCKDELLYEGTFCWKCTNFSFAYPFDTSRWLGTTTVLAKIFNKLMPIPKPEIDRFNKKFSKKKKEK